jgi:hypothetical protein
MGLVAVLAGPLVSVVGAAQPASAASYVPIAGSGSTWSYNAIHAWTGIVAQPVAAGTIPGLAGGSLLAAAAANRGLGTTVLGAGLDLLVPADTAPGTYAATLTVTAVESG